MSLVGVEVIDHHTRALASKCQGGGSADAATGAGDDGGPAREHNLLRGLLDSIVSNPGNTGRSVHTTRARRIQSEEKTPHFIVLMT